MLESAGWKLPKPARSSRFGWHARLMPRPYGRSSTKPVEDGLATFDAAPRSLEDQKRLIASAERDLCHPVLVAEVRNWLCDSVAIEPHDDLRGLEDMGEIVLFVRRSFRSYGIGRQLMRVAQAEAARLGYRKLIGRMLADNRDGPAALPSHRLARSGHLPAACAT